MGNKNYAWQLLCCLLKEAKNPETVTVKGKKNGKLVKLKWKDTILVY